MNRPARLLPILGAIAAVCAVISTDAQARRRAGSRTRQAAQQKQDTRPTLNIGEVKLSGFDKLTFRQDEWAQAAGPNTTVDAADPKQPQVKSRLQSPLLKAFLNPKDSSEVEKVDAAGPVRFSSVRPVGKLGVRVLKGTASHAVYFRTEGRLELQGPITFEGEQPTPDGKARQSAAGNAQRATYDLNRELITLTGGVDATILLPDRKPSKLTNADRVTIDLSDQKYQLDVNGGTIDFDASKPPAEKKP